MANIVVLGAGVSGLTCALQLARSNPNHRITVVAKHMPGDYDIEYASPWAGANYMPTLAAKHEMVQNGGRFDWNALRRSYEGDATSTTGNTALLFERDTWPELERLARHVPECGIHFQETILYRRTKDVGTPVGEWFEELTKDDGWFPKTLPNFQSLPKASLPADMDSGAQFTSVCINTSLYLPWLASQCLARGVVLKRGIAPHISASASLHHSNTRADLVINCTGLSSLRLGGVQDANLYPGRGQVVVVRNDPGAMYSVSGTDDPADESCYIMHRAAGGGCILGGCMQADRWESQPDPNLAVRIMQRAVALCPRLVPEGKGVEALSVVRHGVGLRPMRKGGIRVEREVVDGVPVVHNYGHGGYGYQTSYGAAQAVVELVREVVPERARL